MIGLFEAVRDFMPLWLLVSVRVGVMFASMPAPFGDLSPMRVRAVMGLAVSLAIAIPNTEVVPAIAFDPWVMGRAAVGEALVGVVIGLTVRVTIAAAEVAGNVAGMGMGLGFANSVDPLLGENSTPVARLLSSFSALIFLLLQGHYIVLASIAQSLRHAPVGDVTSAILHDGILEIGTSMMAQGLRIAAPVIATLFIVQVGTGLISRAAPRVHLMVLTFGVSGAAGITALYLAAPSLATAIAAEMQRLPHLLNQSLGVL